MRYAGRRRPPGLDHRVIEAQSTSGMCTQRRVMDVMENAI